LWGSELSSATFDEPCADDQLENLILDFRRSLPSGYQNLPLPRKKLTIHQFSGADHNVSNDLKASLRHTGQHVLYPEIAMAAFQGQKAFYGSVKPLWDLSFVPLSRYVISGAARGEIQSRVVKRLGVQRVRG